jgi:hypothetical protein
MLAPFEVERALDPKVCRSLDPWHCGDDVIWRKAPTGTGRPRPWSDCGGVRRRRGCGGPRPWTGHGGGMAVQSTAADTEEAVEAEARCISDIGGASGREGGEEAVKVEAWWRSRRRLRQMRG